MKQLNTSKLPKIQPGNQKLSKAAKYSTKQPKPKQNTLHTQKNKKKPKTEHVVQNLNKTVEHSRNQPANLNKIVKNSTK